MVDKNLIKLQHFFEADLKLKKEMLNMALPKHNEYIDNHTISKYVENVNESLTYLFSELKCISLELFGEESPILKQVYILENIIKNKFYLCGYDIDKLNMFYKTFISNMDTEFLNSVKHECVGYSLGGYSSIEKATSVNELLHFIHFYIMNNEEILKCIPKIEDKNNKFEYPITLRGKNIPLFNEIFNHFPNELDVGDTDMVAIEYNKLLIMARDRGHALTIEITINNDIARLEYFIPKLCNIDMINSLPGINRVNKQSSGATGVFEVPVNELSLSLFDFISKVPTDADMVFDDFKKNIF